MSTEMIIVLCILAFMVVMLLSHKLPYGVTGMICCVLFVLTGVADLKTAFSGLSSSTTLMIAPMIVVASAIGKTSLVRRLRGMMNKLEGKSGIFLVLALCVLTIALSQLMGQVACISVMLLFVQTLDESSDLSPARMLFLVATINCIATSKIPIGMGATMPGTINSYYEGLVGPENLLGITDYCKAGLLPLIVGTIYCIFAYKLIPNGSIDKSQVKEVKEQQEISKKDEMIIFGVFAVIMAGFMFTNQLGSDITNVLPAAGVLVFILFHVLPLQEILLTLTGDMVWMVAGMSVMSTVLGKTGVGELIGETVLKILGGNPSGLFVSIVFCVACTIMTNFLSNMGTMALMSPIAAATAMAGGMNVKAVVLTCCVSAWFAIALPTGCSGAMMAFGIGNHNAFKLMKFTLPLLVLLMISLIIGINIFFPIYG
ncbi:MAG: SLC13 family permease [Lachnospiraceae bacterium]|nr:SLC13 family permease [Lachnospiraceae bacterium]